jgi:hypothetical protein
MKRQAHSVRLAHAAQSSDVQARADAARAANQAASDEQRHAMIAEAAYFRAEKRGFAPGAELEDWLAAEAEIDGRLAEQTLLEHQLAHSDT